MPKPTIRIHDLESDKIIDRQMTDDELAIYQAEMVAFEQNEITEQKKAKDLSATKAAVLERLGITEDEAKALLS